MVNHDINLYLDASNRGNIERSDEGTVRHFEIEWGGLLPTTPDGVIRYLAHYAESMTIKRW